ncbi:MAG: maleylpyruvate isomerase family mycothiol-dependent enzyme [Actinomycetota bacterium]|nr:maleylpyruvate isomerase family mycothiol-dependent enzyme [Actinomycetota bacterium]MDQ2957154.1 maleylpyruvate isomerase family mycothiol-dependent enzyme [Actinomycetota bacterium]
MELDQLLDELRSQGELLAQSAGHANLADTIPSCPGWTIASAMGHTAKVHRWAAWVVRGGDPAGFDYERPEPALLESEYRAGLADLLLALRQAPDSLDVHTFWPSKSPRLFWARRQAHETAIHRVDVQLGAGYGVTDFEADFAADGIDELLMGMAPNAFSTIEVAAPQTIALTPLDANISWTVRIAPDGTATRRGADDHADLSVFGLASDLYRWVWNRAADHEVSLRGDVTLADRWRSNFTVGARPR